MSPPKKREPVTPHAHKKERGREERKEGMMYGGGAIGEAELMGGGVRGGGGRWEGQ